MSDTQIKPLLVLDPEVANTATKKMLRRAGYVVLVARPDQVTQVDVVSIATIDLTTRAALESILGHGCDSVRSGFTKRFARALLDSTK